MKDIEKAWDEFWKPIVTNEDGTLNLEQVKKELLDSKLVMDMVPTVYDSITGGRFTKLLTNPEFIIGAAEEHFKNMFDIDEIKENLEIEHNKAYKSLEDEIEGWKAENRILKEWWIMFAELGQTTRESFRNDREFGEFVKLAMATKHLLKKTNDI